MVYYVRNIYCSESKASDWSWYRHFYFTESGLETFCCVEAYEVRNGIYVGEKEREGGCPAVQGSCEGMSLTAKVEAVEEKVMNGFFILWAVCAIWGV